MNYASVCSGIEAATVAWEGLGWKPQWFSEIEPFPCKVLSYRFPNVPNLGDMTKLNNHQLYHEKPISLLVGGTPCQSFSIAGLRGGLHDERGNLALEFCRILIAKQPQWFVWENVPGVFSSGGGKDFETILFAFRECGYSCAWRVLDAQYYGVPQRRRRVFVVGYLGNDWRPPYAVLFERDSMQGDFEASAKQRQKTAGKVEGNIETAVPTLTRQYAEQSGQDDALPCIVAETIAFRQLGLGDYRQDLTASTLKDRDNKDATDLVIQTTDAFNFEMYSGECKEISPALQKERAKDTIVYPVSFADQNKVIESFGIDSDKNGTLEKIGTLTSHKTGGDQQSVAILLNTMTMMGRPSDKNRMGDGIGENGDPQNTLSKNHMHAVATTLIARRLTPLECERLQGFPDNHTNIPGAKDGPRYSAIGNSMAVPVMKWIGTRIDMVDKMLVKIKNG